MTDTYNVSFEITPSAVLEAGLLHQATFLARARVVLILIVSVGILIAIVGEPSIGLAIAIPGVLILGLTWAQFVDRWLVTNRGRGVIGGRCQYMMDDRGIHYEHPLGSGVLPWAAITDVRANEKSIVFGRDRVLAAYIPTIAFASHAERDTFLAFARERVGGQRPNA